MIAVNLFNNGLSLRAISIRLSVCRMRISKILKEAGIETDRRKRRSKFIDFNGKRYTQTEQGYYRCENRKLGRTYLHRDIFEHHHGRKIKEGWQVDHIDQDKENNAPENLAEMEIDEHSAKGQRWHGHPAQSNNYQRMQKENAA